MNEKRPDWATVIIKSNKSGTERYAAYTDSNILVGGIEIDPGEFTTTYNKDIWEVIETLPIEKEMNIEKETISFNILIDNGYNEWKVDHFQKRIDNDYGKKYFINCKKYVIPMKDSNVNWWEFDVTLKSKNGSINISTVQWFNNDGIHSQNTIQDVENYFETIFNFHDKPYFEKY